VAQEIRTITLHGRLYQVNCYLVRGDHGWVLIDTGLATSGPSSRGPLEAAGCRPGGLRLILLTHGDADHAGNAPTCGGVRRADCPRTTRMAGVEQAT